MLQLEGDKKESTEGKGQPFALSHHFVSIWHPKR